MSLRSGSLRDKVTLVSEVQSGVDALNQPNMVWTEGECRICSIEPLNGKEFYAAEGQNTSVTHRIRFRWERGLLNAQMRLRDKTFSPYTEYEIITPPIDPGNEHRELVLMCKVAT